MKQYFSFDVFCREIEQFLLCEFFYTTSCKTYFIAGQTILEI